MTDASAIRTFPLRLHPGQDLRVELTEFTRTHDIKAGCIVSAVGSLTRANIRYGGKADGALTTGDLEIVSLIGTLSHDGPHLHLAVADGNGHVVGGHMLDGCIVRTTLELVIGELTDCSFRRQQDPATGFRELTIEPSDDSRRESPR